MPFGDHCWVTFSYFVWFEVSKSMFGLQAWFLMIFAWKICSFLMSQPLKNTLNTMVFIRFHFSDFFVILMISGTSWDLILEVFGSLETPFWWFMRLLRIPWISLNSMVSWLAPESRAPCQGVVKTLIPGGIQLTTTVAGSYKTWNLQDVQDESLQAQKGCKITYWKFGKVVR